MLKCLLNLLLIVWFSNLSLIKHFYKKKKAEFLSFVKKGSFAVCFKKKYSSELYVNEVMVKNYFLSCKIC